MATSEILGLFASPEQYQANQMAQFRQRAANEVQLDPFQQAAINMRQAGYQLGGGIAGALGGVDPQLQKITQRQQILGMIDPANPESYARGIQAALQVGDQEAAFLLRNEMMKAREQASVAEIRGFERDKFLVERGQGMQQRGMEARALSIANGINPDTGESTKPLFDPTTKTFNEDVANLLVSQYGQAGANLVKQRLESVQGVESLQVQQLARTLFKPDGTRDKDVEARLSTTVAGREVLKKLAPETKELKKGEKLLERQPNGTWKLITPEGQPVQNVTSDNAIQTLITSKAIHPTILPYANQLAKNFANLDFEDQNGLLEKLTKLNSDAQRYESDKSARDQSRYTNNTLRELNVELARLKIKQAQDEAEKAKDGKPINFGDSTKLAERATGVDKLVDLYDTFKPEYAGYGTDAAGEIAVFAAGKQSDEKSVALYQWWQNYQNNVNKVRNDLFGSALTAPEKAEFERAMVTKGMNSAQAQQNLQRQADQAAKAYEKLEKVLRSQGFSKAALDALKPTGIKPPLSNFVVEGQNTNPSNITGGVR
jgi:hypothetical protein